DAGAALRERPLEGLDVDLGLAAASDAVEQKRLRLAPVERGSDLGERGRLPGVERVDRGRRGRLGRVERRADDLAPDALDGAFFDEALDRRARRTGFGEDVGLADRKSVV